MPQRSASYQHLDSNTRNWYCVLICESHVQIQTNIMLVHLETLPDFLSVALSSKPTGSYWRCQSFKTPHKYLVSSLKSLSNFKQLLTVVFIKQTGGNSASVGDYFQRRMNPHVVLLWVFGAAGRCADCILIFFTSDLVWTFENVFTNKQYKDRNDKL